MIRAMLALSLVLLLPMAAEAGCHYHGNTYVPGAVWYDSPLPGYYTWTQGYPASAASPLVQSTPSPASTSSTVANAPTVVNVYLPAAAPATTPPLSVHVPDALAPKPVAAKAMSSDEKLDAILQRLEALEKRVNAVAPAPPPKAP